MKLIVLVVLVVLVLSNVVCTYYLVRKLTKLESAIKNKVEAVRLAHSYNSATILSEVKKIPKEMIIKNVLKIP